MTRIKFNFFIFNGNSVRCGYNTSLLFKNNGIVFLFKHCKNRIISWINQISFVPFHIGTKDNKPQILRFIVRKDEKRMPGRIMEHSGIADGILTKCLFFIQFCGHDLSQGTAIVDVGRGG